MYAFTCAPKKRAKVLLFFHSHKYFCTFFAKKCIFHPFSSFLPYLSSIFCTNAEIDVLLQREGLITTDKLQMTNKVLRNGQHYMQRGNEVFDVQGARVK